MDNYPRLVDALIDVLVDIFPKLRKDDDIMKLPNGFGSVYKLSGSRRNPWRAVKTFSCIFDESTGKRIQKRKTIGYYPTQAEAIQALSEYNSNPYDLDTNSITFSEVYEKWSEIHFAEIVPSARRTWKSAYSYCKPLYNMRMKDIRVNHLEETIRHAEVGDNTKGRMKSLFNLMYKYALKNEIVDKNYAALCDSIKKPRPQIVRTPFTDDEIQTLWNNLSVPFADMVLIGIYTGFRPQELAILRLQDINIEEGTIVGGLKTEAGKNRIVPIHSKVRKLVESRYEEAERMKSEYLFNDADGQQGTYMTYDKYRRRFDKLKERLHFSHKPHDTRHTFITKAKAVGMDEYILKLLVGHAIQDVTERVYTHRTLDQMKEEIEKIK